MLGACTDAGPQPGFAPPKAQASRPPSPVGGARDLDDVRLSVDEARDVKAVATVLDEFGLHVAGRDHVAEVAALGGRGAVAVDVVPGDGGLDLRQSRVALATKGEKVAGAPLLPLGPPRARP